MIQLLSQIIEQSAQRLPQNVAFRCRDRSLNYAELNAQASRLAALLQKFGVQPGDRVAVYMPKAVEMAVSVYGCLNVGAIYVPVDPALPASRLKYVLEDAGVSAILTLDRQRRQLDDVWPELECKPLVVVGLSSTDHIDAAVVPWDAVDTGCDFVPPDLSESDPAYIIYTSGSTGEPKGILHTHRSGLAYARLAAETYGVHESDRLGNFAPLHFDQSTFEFFSGPLVGATTVLIPEEHMRFPASLAKLIDDERLTIWYSVPFALVQLLLRGALETRDLSSLRWVLYGGEPFAVGHLRELMNRLPAATFSNVYGPAEVNQCTYFNLPLPPEDLSVSVPIGRIWPETAGIIVDEQEKPVATGEIGELLIHSSTMMQGYWNRPEMTARVMIDLPYHGNSLRFFRTGDLVRELGDGNLEFHGRSDRQVKIRGNRVELDEIEAVVLGLPGVLNAAAFTQADAATNDRRIILAVILSADVELTVDLIRDEARQCLPNYAVPSEVIVTDRFPQTTSSKTDYIALSRSSERCQSADDPRFDHTDQETGIHRSPEPFARIPETDIIMEEAESVSAFFDAGQRGGPLSPIYQFSCRVLSQLLPKNGVVLDIGCGPGQFLTRLLKYRPDLKGIGSDLSPRMLTTAGDLAEQRAVASRVEFVQTDFASVDRAISGHVDGVICMSALHHCPDFDSLVATLSAIKRLSERQSCAIWLFDLVRPQNVELCELIPRTHEVSAGELLPARFRHDWTTSLKAGWTFDEFRAALNTAGLSLQSATANCSQLHWRGSRQTDKFCPEVLDIFDPADTIKSESLATALGVDLPAGGGMSTPT